jgi:hypothetical protein
MAKRKRVPAWRKAFLGVLRRTGNIRLAALQAGADKGTAYAHRARDPGFAARWDAARAKGKAAAAAGRKAPLGKVSVELVLRNSKRGPKYVRAAEGRWSPAIEDRFLAALERTGCIRWAAAAAEMSTTTIYYRRRRYPDLAARMAAAEARAKDSIPGYLTAATIASFDPEIEGEGLPPVNVDQAIAIVKLKCGPGSAGGRDAVPEPPIEEVRASIMRKLDAIEAHERKQAARKEDGDGPGGTAPGEE